MSTMGAVGAASGAWSPLSAMRERMFAKVDSDGSGSVDKTELQSMIDDISSHGGTSAGDAGELLQKMDSNGDGSLDSSELDEGMKSLMPPPASTQDFARQRAGGMPPSGPPPGAAGGTSGTTGATATDPLDTDGDGTVSAKERAAGQLDELLQRMLSAMDGNGDGSVDGEEASSFAATLAQDAASTATATASGTAGGSSSSDRSDPLEMLRALARRVYAEVASPAASTTSVAVSA